MWEVGSGINISSLRGNELISDLAYFFNDGGLLLVQAIHVSSFIIRTTIRCLVTRVSFSQRICWRESESTTQSCSVFMRGDRERVTRQRSCRTASLTSALT